jgi:hypothetical protein
MADLYGELVFRADGSIEKASFETVDRTLLIDVLPGSDGVALNIEGRAWQPAGTPISFASLQAKEVAERQIADSEHRHHVSRRHSAGELVARVEQWFIDGWRWNIESTR